MAATISSVMPMPMVGRPPICVVCAKENPLVERRLKKSNGKATAASYLLEVYGGVKIEDGVLCRNCFRRLQTIDKLVSGIRSQLSANAHLYRSTPCPPTCSDQNASDNVAIPSTFVVKPLCSSCIKATKKPKYKTLAPKHSRIAPRPQSVIPHTKEVSKAKGELNETGSVTVDNMIGMECSPDLSDQVQQKPKAQHVNIGDHSYLPTIRQGPEDNIHLSGLDEVMAGYGNRSHCSGPESMINNEYAQLLKALQTRSVVFFVQQLMKMNRIRETIVYALMRHVNLRLHSTNIGARMHSPSLLMSKKYDDLQKLNWVLVVKEALEKCPELVQLALAVSVCPENLDAPRVSSLIPKIGLLYSVFLKERHQNLSRAQRALSLMLYQNFHQGKNRKVFESLQSLGVCLCYTRTLEVADSMKGHFSDKLKQSLWPRKRSRMAGKVPVGSSEGQKDSGKVPPLDVGLSEDKTSTENIQSAAGMSEQEDDFDMGLELDCDMIEEEPKDDDDIKVEVIVDEGQSADEEQHW